MFANIKEVFSKEKKDEKTDNIIPVDETWYKDRYGKILAQRNWFFIILIMSLALITLTTTYIAYLSSQQKIQPFVVSVDKNTGIPAIVDPVVRRHLPSDEAISKYFVLQYINARESYNDINYEYNYRTVVRLLSSSSVYSVFRRFVFSDDGPIKKYGKGFATTVKLRSVAIKSLHTNGGVATVRFTVGLGKSGESNFSSSQYKIVDVGFIYQPMQLTPEQIGVNPLGFTVTSYVISDELLNN